MFPANDIAYLKQVLEDCGTVSRAVGKILGDEETPSSVHGMEGKTQFSTLASMIHVWFTHELSLIPQQIVESHHFFLTATKYIMIAKSF